MKQIGINLLILALSFITISARADDAVLINGIYYNLIPKANLAEVDRNPQKYEGNIVIPEKVTYEGTVYKVTKISSSSFYGCKKMTSISIPPSVTTIESSFEDCKQLKEVHISDIAAWTQIDFTFYRNNPLRYARHLYLDDKEVKDLILPSNISKVNAYAFLGCNSLVNLVIPNNVTELGQEAFRLCDNLKTVDMGEGLSIIDYWAFNDCVSLESVVISSKIRELDQTFINSSNIKEVIIPNSVTRINYAFEGCTSLSSVKFGSGLKSLCHYAFKNCPLVSITVDSNNMYLDSRNNCNAVIDKNINQLLLGSASTVIPNDVISIGESAFMGNVQLTSINIPNSVRTIGHDAFNGCKNLKKIVVGNGLKSVGKKTFCNCKELTDFYCYSELNPYAYSGTFDNSYIEYATLHVPSSSIEYYRTTDPWKRFGSIVAITNGTSIDTPINNAYTINCQSNVISIGGLSDNTIVTVYDCLGHLLQKSKSVGCNMSIEIDLPKGSLSFVKIGDKVVKVLIK